MLNNRKLTHKSTGDKHQVFTGKSGSNDITIWYPLNDEILVKVFVNDSYIGAFEITDITEETDISKATENFLWNTNALHDHF